MSAYMPTLIEKLKEDVLKLKSLCTSLKDVDSSTATNNQQEIEHDSAFQKWLDDKKLLAVKTDLVTYSNILIFKYRTAHNRKAYLSFKYSNFSRS
jgi:hypothetical protein